MLDTSSLYVALAVLMATVFVLFYFVTYRSSRAPYAGWWCATLGLQAIARVLYLWDGTAHRVWTNPVAITLDTLATDMAHNTRQAGAQLAGVPDAAAGLVLERIRDQLGATDLVLWNASGQALASVGQSRYELTPERPSSASECSIASWVVPADVARANGLIVRSRKISALPAILVSGSQVSRASRSEKSGSCDSARILATECSGPMRFTNES